MNLVRHSLRLLALTLLPGLLAAQSPASLRRAVQSITPADIGRRIGIIADDSMRGRDTPSPELEKVAAYIAAEFRRFGLRPGGDSGTYLQRYVVRRTQIDTAQTFLTVARAGGGSTMLGAGSDIAVLRLGPRLPAQDVSGPIVVLAGDTDAVADPLAGADVKGTWIVALDVRAAEAALAAGAVGVLVISDRSDAEWRAGMRAANGATLALGGHSSLEV